MTLDGRFLQEDWRAGSRGGAPEPTAEAFFSVANGDPGDFIAVYESGRMAFGESTFVASQWTLTHRWLREPGVADIRLRFVDADTYEQEVFELSPEGEPRLESRAILRRLPDRLTRVTPASQRDPTTPAEPPRLRRPPRHERERNSY